MNSMEMNIMKKNSQIHLVLETELLELLKKEALDREISISEHIRQKLRKNTQLTRIEILLEKLLKGGQNLGKRSSRFCY